MANQEINTKEKKTLNFNPITESISGGAGAALLVYGINYVVFSIEETSKKETSVRIFFLFLVITVIVITAYKKFKQNKERALIKPKYMWAAVIPAILIGIYENVRFLSPEIAPDLIKKMLIFGVECIVIGLVLSFFYIKSHNGFKNFFIYLVIISELSAFISFEMLLKVKETSTEATAVIYVFMPAIVGIVLGILYINLKKLIQKN